MPNINKKIKNAAPQNNEQMFVTWTDGQDIHAALANNKPIFRTVASGIIERDRESTCPTVMKLSNCSERGYSLYRENRSVIHKCMWAYKNISILKNVVDLMADFVCDGIEIVHPNRRIETFLQYWAKKVNFTDRSERFTNLLIRAGNVVVQKSNAKLKAKDVNNLQRGQADADIEVDTPPKVYRNEIPWNYIINSPLNVEIIGGDELATYAGKVEYAIRIPPKIASKIKNPKNLQDRLLTSNIPDYIKKAALAGSELVPLDPEKVSVYSYKKDDWEGWADPISACILKNLVMLEKLQDADMAALDGAISHVRLWKLGNIEAKLYPTEAAVNRLAEMLASAIGGGAMDIIWGPDLDFKETATDIYKFLGIEKYAPTLIAIYDGLGIPLALTSYGGKAGASNNYFSLQVLVKRLEYIRNILISMWEKELRIIEQAFGFRTQASIRFKRMNLSDESAEKALLVQLVDRNLISAETLQERFGELPELEVLRQNREDRERAAGKRPKKAGQWFDAAHDEALQKISLQTGQVTPGELGVNLKPRKPGEKTVIEQQTEQMKLKNRSQEAAKKQRGQVGQGRPAGKKDSQKRAKKNVRIQKARASFTNAFTWSQTAQDEIAKIVNPVFLEMAGKKTSRSLSDEQSKNLDNLKFSILCNLQLYQPVTEEVITGFITQKEPLSVPTAVSDLYKRTLASFVTKFNREPSVEEIRNIHASVYASYKGEY